MSTDKVNVIILFEVVDKLKGKLALADALKYFKLIHCQLCYGIISRSSRHLLHFKQFFRASVNSDPSCVYLVVGQIFFEFVLTNTVPEALCAQQVVYAIDH